MRWIRWELKKWWWVSQLSLWSVRRGRELWEPVWPQLSGVPLFWATCLTDSVSFSWGSLTSTHTISFLSLDSTTFNNTHIYTHNEYRRANAPVCPYTHTHTHWFTHQHTKKQTVNVSWEPLKLTVFLIITCCDWFFSVIYFITTKISVLQPVIPPLSSPLHEWQQFKW